MIRLFNVYYPTRTIVLLLCEALIVSGCFLLATVLLMGPDTYLVLNYENGTLKILALTILTLLFSYYFDLYEPQRISASWEIYFRLLLVLGFLSFLLSVIIFLFPAADIAHYVLLLGLSFLTVALVLWRSVYGWLLGNWRLSQTQCGCTDPHPVGIGGQRRRISSSRCRRQRLFGQIRAGLRHCGSAAPCSRRRYLRSAGARLRA